MYMGVWGVGLQAGRDALRQMTPCVDTVMATLRVCLNVWARAKCHFQYCVGVWGVGVQGGRKR